MSTPSPDPLPFIAEVAQAYLSLAAHSETSLGGQLLYAGELSTSLPLLVAANIAGAASLAATSNPAAQKQAIRSGVIDFLVTNLDEALRILKNEIRKHEPVSVAVSLAPQIIEPEMLHRGVLPNLLSPHLDPATTRAFLAQSAHLLAAPPAGPAAKLLIWQIPADYAQRPAAFDAKLLDLIPEHNAPARRWLRQAPRYLGAHSRRLRSLICDEATASNLIDVLGAPLHP